MGVNTLLPAAVIRGGGAASRERSRVSEGMGFGKELPVPVPENEPVSFVVPAAQDPRGYCLLLIITASSQDLGP